MIRHSVIWSTVVSLMVLAGCNRWDPDSLAAEPYLASEVSVGFELEPLQSAGDSQAWRGTYASQGKIARFRVEFGPAKTSPGEAAKDFSVRFGEGRFVPEPGSDSTALLVELQKALQAKAHFLPTPKRMSVTFTYANIGDNLSQAAGGGFNVTPPGNWTAFKLFFGHGEQEGQVFLNINAKIKKGQFSMKDPDYGDLVLTELAKVL